MAGIAELAVKCVQDAQDAMQSIAELQSKTIWHLYSADELLSSTTGMVLPAAGVVYEGIRPVELEVKDTHKTGLSGQLVLALVLLWQGDTYGGMDRNAPLRLLDSIRNSMKDRRSPSGHYWRFVVEAAAVANKGGVVWVQRWMTPVQLV